MNSKLQLLLVALGFAAIGTGVTFAGFRLAMHDNPAVTAQATDTAPPTGRAALRTRSARPSRSTHGPMGRAGGPPPRGGRPHGGSARGLATIADELELTTEQRQAWVQMMQNVRRTCGTEGMQGSAVALDLFKAVSAAPDTQPEALHGQLDARLDTQREAAHCVLAELLTFESSLTPEQRTAISTRLGQLEQRRQAWMEGWSL